MMPYLIEQNWLVSYATTKGIAQILAQMDRRTKNISGMTSSINELLEFYDEFENEFTLFMEAVHSFAKEKLLELS